MILILVKLLYWTGKSKQYVDEESSNIGINTVKFEILTWK